MVDIAFTCPRCGGHLVVDGTGAGCEVPCPLCGERIVIPRPEAPRSGRARLGKPKSIELSASGPGGALAPHLVRSDAPAGTKVCAGCGRMVPAEAATCPECLHEFPPPRHFPDGLHVRGDTKDSSPGASTRGTTIGRHAVVATCPKCQSRVFLACGACGRADAFRMDSHCVNCFCGADTDEVDCPRCGAVIDRRGFRVHFEGITGKAPD